jgi:hypothetical protein
MSKRPKIEHDYDAGKDRQTITINWQKAARSTKGIEVD